MEHYYPKTYLTLELVKSVIKEFEWGETYELEDYLPDGIIVSFPKCNLMFSEYGEGEVTVSFLDTTSLNEYTLDIIDGVMTIKSLFKDIEPPILDEMIIPFSSLEKVKTGLNNLCKLLQCYLMDCLKGDYSWVEDFKKLNT